MISRMHEICGLRYIRNKTVIVRVRKTEEVLGALAKLLWPKIGGSAEEVPQSLSHAL